MGSMLGDGIFISAYVSNCHATLAAASHPRGGALRLPILTFRPGARLSQMKVTKTCSIWATAMVNTMADLGNYCNQALGIHIGLLQKQQLVVIEEIELVLLYQLI